MAWSGCATMIVMPRRWSLREFRWRPRFGGPAAWWCLAVAALTPKCALCLFAYAGLGATFAPAGREWCGAPADVPGLLMTAGAWLGFMGLGLLAGQRCLRRRCPGAESHGAPGAQPQPAPAKPSSQTRRRAAQRLMRASRR
jgi:hypothetical protein